MDRKARNGWVSRETTADNVTDLSNNNACKSIKILFCLEISEEQLLRTPKLVLNEEKQLDGSLKDLVKIRRHFINLLLMVFFWSSSSFSLYMVNYSIKNIPGDFFWNNLISAILDVPVSILAGYLYHKLGLRIVLCSFYLVSLMGAIAIIISSETNKDLVPIMIAFAKGGVKVTFDICYLANSFLFPAIFAGTAFGFCNAGAKISTILSPMLAEVNPPIPMIVLSILTASGAVSSLFVKTAPEHLMQ